MSLQDPTADCLTRIRNGLMRGKKVVHAPFSKFKHELVSLLVKEGYLRLKKLEGKKISEVDLVKFYVDECFNSDDYKEGRAAFKEKRTPLFQGK